MSEETIITKSPARSAMTWIIRGLFWSIVVLVFSLMTGCTLLVEPPIRFLIGWLLHMAEVFPPLFANWRKVLLPAGCLVLAGILIHRFVRRTLEAKGNSRSWRPADTLAWISLLLLGCGAAIALSGIVHQTVWLMGDPWIEKRGRRAELTQAVNNARQLMMALMEFHDQKGNYPNSLRELETNSETPPRLSWMQPGNGKVLEPFILLHPGRKQSVSGDEPLIVSPVIPRVGKFAVGYGDGSVRSLSANQLDSILNGGGKRSSETTPHR